MKDSTGAEAIEILVRETSYYYDNNGNQTTQNASYRKPISTEQPEHALNVDAEGETTFSNAIELVVNKYDGFNRLQKVESIKKGLKTIVEFAYNGDDLRTSKTVKKSNNNYQPEVTMYYYDRQHVIVETNDSGSIQARYVRGINYIARIGNDNHQSYYLYNGHGDVVQTVAENGTVENQYDYDIFGNPILTVEEGGYSNAIRYSGEFYDQETGLYYLRARYYDSYTGRFVSEDSYWGEDSNPLSLNLYTYCENDPVDFIDPSGHGKVWNDYGEVIGTCDGDDYTVHGKEGTDIHGGGDQANKPYCRTAL